MRAQLLCRIILGLLISGQTLSLWGQLGRASVTGIVHDSTGAVVPNVSVVVLSSTTGVTYDTTTNQVGNYTVGALPVGEYSVTFKAAGFKELVQSGITLTAGQIARIDPVLEVGDLVEKLTITAEVPMLQTETTQPSSSVVAPVFSDLPLNFSSGRNMVQFASSLVPGVVGASWDTRILGGAGGTAGVVIDGMTNLAGFLPGDFREQAVSPEAIQELNVNMGSTSAELGRQGAGTMNFTLKSGTNQPHGSAFYYLRNEVFNANTWNNNRLLAADPTFSNPSTINFKRPRDREKDWGWSLGGPVVIPKIYNGKNRTFFFFTMERYLNNTSGPSSLSLSVPQPEMWQGNLSRLMTNTQVGTDALGRAVYQGQIFDPTTLRQTESGRYVADAFSGNIIPASRLSTVAKNFAKIFGDWYPPVSSDLVNNLYGSNMGRDQSNTYSVKIDHAFTSNHRVSGYYYKHALPVEQPEDSSSIWSIKDPKLGGPLARPVNQTRHGYNWNANYDWIVSPRVLNHAAFGINNDVNPFTSMELGQSYADAWGIKGVGAGADPSQVTRPLINLGESPVATFSSWGSMFNDLAHYRGVIFSDSVSYQRGTHLFKAGFEWNAFRGIYNDRNSSGGIFNFDSRTTSIPGESFTNELGNSFASLLLGLVDSASLPPSREVVVDTSYFAIFAQDNWKVSPKLTLNYGLRWSGNAARTEKNGNMAMFNPTLPDPNYGGALGAVEYMGTGPGRAGRNALYPGNWKDVGPNFGFAYRITNRLVARGGYGISFIPEGFGWNWPWPAGLRATNDAPADSMGTYLPVFNIDNGYSGAAQAASADPSYAAKFGGSIVSPSYARPGYAQNFNLGFQGEVSKDLLLELDYRASVSSSLHCGDCVIPNQINPKELSRGAVLTQEIDSPQQAAAAGLPYPYAGFSGLGAYTLLPFPQLTSRTLYANGDPVGFSTFHSLNLIATKRMGKGYYLYGAYTFSKWLTNVDFYTNGGSTNGLQDTYNRSLYKALSPNDRTHVLKAAMKWELPVGRGKKLLGSANRVLNAIVGDWGVSAILNYQSGTPLGHPSSLVSPAFWNGNDVYANFNTPAGGFKRVFDSSKFNPWNAKDPGNRFFDPTAFSSALPNQLGNSPVRFPQVRMLWSWNEDANLMKRFRIREGLALQFRADALNLLNRHSFRAPDMNLRNSYFGNVRTANGGRTAQVGTRLEW